LQVELRADGDDRHDRPVRLDEQRLEHALGVEAERAGRLRAPAVADRVVVLVDAEVHARTGQRDGRRGHGHALAGPRPRARTTSTKPAPDSSVEMRSGSPRAKGPGASAGSTGGSGTTAAAASRGSVIQRFSASVRQHTKPRRPPRRSVRRRWAKAAAGSSKNVM